MQAQMAPTFSFCENDPADLTYGRYITLKVTSKPRAAIKLWNNPGLEKPEEPAAINPCHLN